MQAPPDEHGYAPPKKQSYLWLWILLGVFVVCGCGAIVVLPAILFPVFSQARRAAVRAQCMSNVKQLVNGSLMYASDFDDKLPVAAKWQDSIEKYMPYYPEAFTCPALRRSGGRNGYAAAKDLSGKKLDQIRTPATTVWIYETADLARNANGDPVAEPPPNRHGPGRTVGHADGSAKFLKQ
jgi:hypothetical protein